MESYQSDYEYDYPDDGATNEMEDGNHDDHLDHRKSMVIGFHGIFLSSSSQSDISRPGAVGDPDTTALTDFSTLK